MVGIGVGFCVGSLLSPNVGSIVGWEAGPIVGEYVGIQGQHASPEQDTVPWFSSYTIPVDVVNPFPWQIIQILAHVKELVLDMSMSDILTHFPHHNALQDD